MGHVLGGAFKNQGPTILELSRRLRPPSQLKSVTRHNKNKPTDSNQKCFGIRFILEQCNTDNTLVAITSKRLCHDLTLNLAQEYIEKKIT